MTNNYQKTYPDLMAGKKILYLHGFGSAGSTHTAQALRSLMPQASVISPDIPVSPEEALPMLLQTTQQEQPDLIIGTSMGGMYTELMKGFDRICVNPAFQMADTMHEHGMVGKQTFQNPRQDGVQEFLVTKAMVKEYKAVTERCFSDISHDEQQRVFGLFGDNDQTVHTYDLFLSHYPNAIRFHGEHRLNDKVLLHSIIPVIRWIDDRQEGRERPSVLIDFDTMYDGYMNPASSLRKAYEFLTENYEVFIVADAPATNPSYMQEVTAWTYEHINVPTWNHLIFTNYPELVNADYLVWNDVPKEMKGEGIIASPQAIRDEARKRIGQRFLGTVLEFGKDELKTFEDVVTFFGRLGGQ